MVAGSAEVEGVAWWSADVVAALPSALVVVDLGGEGGERLVELVEWGAL